MNIETVPIGTVKANPDNPRSITPTKYQQLLQSIKEFPETLELRPIIVDENMVTLGGNMRLKACNEAGLSEIPIIRADKLTEEQKKEFLIKDNLPYGEWDYDLLRKDWSVPLLETWGMELPDLREPEATEDDYRIPEKIETTIQPGDMFSIGVHRLICGDARSPKDMERLMDGQLADMVMTDPPYNVDYEGSDGQKIMNDKQTDGNFYEFLLQFYTNVAAHTKPGGAWYVWHADSEGSNFRRAFQESGLLLKQCLIWVKNSLVLGRQDYQWRHEPCLYGWKPGGPHYFVNDRNRTTIIKDAEELNAMKKPELIELLKQFMDNTEWSTREHDKPKRNDLHPTMKPIKLLSELIKNSSKQHQIVVDPFGGSGSTMVSCHQLQRRCRMIEQDPRFCQVTIDRMEKLSPGIVIKKL